MFPIRPAIGPNPLFNPSAQPDFHADLSAWRHAAPAGENRNLAAQRILAAHRENASTLDLQQLGLSNFPFHPDLLPSVTLIRLADNPLQDLPAEWAEKVENLPSLLAGFASPETLAKWADHLARSQAWETLAAGVEVNLKLAALLTSLPPDALPAALCKSQAPARIALALSCALRSKFEVSDTAQALLDALPESTHPLIEVDGVMLPRADLEGLVRDPDLEGRSQRRQALDQVFRVLRQGWGANVHLPGLLANGARVWAQFQQRNQVTPPSLEATCRSIEVHPAADDDAREGLQHALRINSPVDLGVAHPDVAEVVRHVWAYCTRQSDVPLRESLTAMFFERLRDIAREQPCNTGCVQRLLQVPEGVDPAFSSELPEERVLSEEISRMVSLIDTHVDALIREDEAARQPLAAPSAQTQASPERGETLLQLKLQSAQTAIERSLVEFRALPRALVASASQKPLDDLERNELYMNDLGLADLSVEYRDHRGLSALQKAVLQKDEAAVRAQARKGADAAVGLEGEDSVFAYAFVHGLTDIVAALTGARGIDPNAARPFRPPALVLAASRGQSDMVRVLLKFDGIDPNAAGDSGYTPLIMAARRGHAGVIRVLMHAPGIDLNTTTKEGSTALMVAARWGRKTAVEALIQADGLEIERTDKHGHTAAMIAKRHGHHEIASLLSAAEHVEPLPKRTKHSA